MGTKVVLPRGGFLGQPKLVTFTDMNDPKSVTLAQEWTRGDRNMTLKADHMEELFGQGVKLKDITLEITDEPVTWGVVDKWLLWMRGIGGGYLDGQFAGGGPELSNILHGGNFKRGQ